MKIHAIDIDRVASAPHPNYEVGRVSWEDGRVSFVSIARMQELWPAYRDEEEVEFEGGDAPHQVLTSSRENLHE